MRVADQQSDGIVCSAQYVQAQMSSINIHNSRAVLNDDVQAQARSVQPVTPQGVLSVARKRRVHSQVSNPAKWFGVDVEDIMIVHVIIPH